LEQRCLLTINEFPTPTPGSNPLSITAGPDGNVWFTEGSRTNKIGQITPEGTISEFPILPITSNAGPVGITTGPDSNLWFTESNSNKIGRIMPDGTHLMEFSIPSSSSFPTQIATGPDGNIWFAEDNTKQIGRLEPATGHIEEFPVFPAPMIPFADALSRTSLAFGPDGNLWFTLIDSDRDAGFIGRITFDGSQVIELPIPTGNSVPTGITLGPDGNLWFTESNANQIAHINPYNFSVKEFKIPTANSDPEQITTGPDGNLWFTENAANKIGRITPDGNIEEFSIPTSNSGPLAITSGPDGNIWFTEQNANKIGEYILSLPATHFLVNATSSSTTGSPFSVTVTALDNLNRTVPGYTGTIHFSSSDMQATLPADYTFTAAENGVHTFPNGAILETAGAQTISVTDTATGVVGSATITVSLPPPPAVSFSISAPEAVVAGSPFTVTVTALNAQGQVATAYTGTVHFTSSDPYPGVFPPDYTITSSDNGVHTFSGVTLYTAGMQSLTAEDTASNSVSGTATVSVSSASANHFLVVAPSTAVAGTSFVVTVTALDAFGNVDTGYVGTVPLTSSDRNPQPSAYTFTRSDEGTHSFTTSLSTAGVQTILARDGADASIAGTTTIAVLPAAPWSFLITAPTSVVGGTAFGVILTALDIYGNTATNYNGTDRFSTTDPGLGIVLPSDYTFTTGDGGDNGVHVFPEGVLLITPGLQSLYATDRANSLLGATQVFVESPPAAPPPGGRTSSPSNPNLHVNSTLRPAEQAAIELFYCYLSGKNSGITFPPSRDPRPDQ
jgi:streptogramin lyase